MLLSIQKMLSAGNLWSNFPILSPPTTIKSPERKVVPSAWTVPSLLHSPPLLCLIGTSLASSIAAIEAKKFPKGSFKLKKIVWLHTKIGRSINVSRSACSKILLTGHLHNLVSNAMWVVDQRHGLSSCNFYPIWRRAALVCSETLYGKPNQSWKCLPL